MSRVVDVRDPAALGRTTFSTSFRGFDQGQVRAFLLNLRTQLEALLADAEATAAHAVRLQEELTAAQTFDDERLSSILGSEMNRILDAAREAAAERIAGAEAEAGEIRAQAELDAAEIRERALGVVNAEQAALVVEAEEELLAARAEAQLLVDEAEVVRRRILADLGRRRELYRFQVEQLRLGRDRLLAGLEHLRTSIDDSTKVVSYSLAEARAAAATLAAPDSVSDATLVAHLEDQLEAARLVGHPIVEDLGEPHDWSTAPDVAEFDEVVDLPDLPDLPDPLAIERDDRSVLKPSGVVLADVVGHEDRIFGAKVPIEFALLPREEVPFVDVGDDVEHVRAVASDPATSPYDIAAEVPDVDLPDDVVVEDDDAAEAVDVDPADPVDPEPEFTWQVDAEHDQDADEAHRDQDPAPINDADVGDLFARLRAERAEAVRNANEVLDQVESSSPSSEQAEPAPEPAEPAPEPAAPAPEPEPEPETAIAEFETASGADPMQQRRDAMAEAERSLGRVVKRLLADEQSELLEHVRQTKGQLVMSEALPDATSHIEKFAEASQRYLHEAAQAGAAAFVGPEYVERVLGADSSQLAWEFVQAFLDPLRHWLHDAFDVASGDEADLARRIRAHYRETKTQRVGRAITDALNAACNSGISEVIAPGTPVLWLLDPANICGPDCSDNALATDVVFGQPFPTGALRPPGHLGCRCLLAVSDA